MRKVCLALLCGLVAVPAAWAVTRSANDGVLELRGVNASSLVITGQSGTIWGQLDRGRLIVTDPIVTDGKIYVSGAEHKRPIAVDDGTVTVYSGTDIRFRVTGGAYKLQFKPLGTDTGAKGIDLTAVGIGVAGMTGDWYAARTGQYALDSGDWVDVPITQHFVPFGVQTPTTPTNP